MATLKQKQKRVVALLVTVAVIFVVGLVVLIEFLHLPNANWAIGVPTIIILVPLLILIYVWIEPTLYHSNNKLSRLIYKVKKVELGKLTDENKIKELKNKFLDFAKAKPELQADTYRYLGDLEFATMDTEEALLHYSEALNHVSTDTEDYFYMINRRATGMMRLGSYEAALKDFEYVSNANPYYSREMGMLFEFGWGVERDLEKSCQLYEQAVRKGNDLAVMSLYENRWRMTHPVPAIDGYAEYMKQCFSQAGYMSGVPVLTESAEAGYAPSQYELGTLFMEGRLGPNKREEAFKWFKLGADQHYLPAMHNLGFLEDYNAGIQIIREAAEEGYAPSQHSVGCSILQELNRDDMTNNDDNRRSGGLSPEERNRLREEAKMWLKRAVDQGYQRAVVDYEAHFGKLPMD